MTPETSPTPSPSDTEEQGFFFGSGSDSACSGSEYSEFSEDSTFERVSVNDEDSFEGFFGDDLSSEDGVGDVLPSPAPIPFWFCNEDPDHVEAVMKCYSDEVIDPKEFQRSLQPFVGSVCRVKVDFESDPFQTFDSVLLCNNQRMAPHSPMPTLRTVYLLSSWDHDGLPMSFFHVPPEMVPSWVARTDSQPRSFVYCLPDWFQAEEGPARHFVYSSSAHYQDVAYANLPWAATPFHECVRSPVALDRSLSQLSSPLFSLHSSKFSP